MHYVIITPKFIPNNQTGGAALYNLSLIQLLLKNGHRVTLIHFNCLEYNPIYPMAAEELRKLGVEIVSFSLPRQNKKKGIFYQLEDNFRRNLIIVP